MLKPPSFLIAALGQHRRFGALPVLAGALLGCQQTTQPGDDPAALPAPALAGAATYTAIDIGGLPSSYFSYAEDINDEGRIVGCSFQAGKPQRGFLRNADGSMLDLGSLGGPDGSSCATALNNWSQVTGFTWTATGWRAFLWSRRTGMRRLGTLGGDGSEGYGINNRGHVVGRSTLRTGREYAFFWSPATGIVNLGTLGGWASRAFDVNDTDQAVGEAWTAEANHPFLWTRDQGMVDLGTLGGSYGQALGINNRGDVVGRSETAKGEVHAFLWIKGEGMIDLGTLGGRYSVAWDINDERVITGTSSLPSGASRAFVKRPAGPMVPLGDLETDLGEGFGINRCGHVVGRIGNHAALWAKACG